MIFRTFSQEAVKVILEKEDLVIECGGTKTDLQNSNLDTNRIIFLMSIIDEEVAGFICFVEFQTHCYFKHWGFYNQYRHQYAIPETLDAFEWLKDRDKKAIVLAMPPITNQASIKGNQKLGMSIIGQTHNTLEINGQLVDQVILQKSL